jgi:putative ABC transport system ATP-binding protein
MITPPHPAALQAEGLGRTYQTGHGPLTVLQDVSFSVPYGATFAIVGPSGSGKTTLLGLCAGLDQPSTGRLLLDGQPLHEMNENQRARLRNQRIGFVFQNFQLMPTLSALENVCLPLELRGGRVDRMLAQQLLAKVGLGNRLDHLPVQLSGGEQQRVAIARAFVGQPTILFADEPTGNLDAESSGIVEEMLFTLNAAQGTTLILVTHDLELAGRCGQILRMKGGRVAVSE